jgi:NADH-quinone oxidoreductase subunit A
MVLVFVFLIVGVLGIVLLSMNALLGPRRSVPNPAKQQPFECGSPPLQDGLRPFPLKFSLVAFIFLLFDVEVVFFFPWALVFKEMRATALVVMLAYAGILAGGFVYAWKKGALRWE